VLELHPDRQRDDPLALQQFLQVTAAYQQLRRMDPSVSRVRINITSVGTAIRSHALRRRTRRRWQTPMHVWSTVAAILFLAAGLTWLHFITPDVTDTTDITMSSTSEPFPYDPTPSSGEAKYSPPRTRWERSRYDPLSGPLVTTPGHPAQAPSPPLIRPPEEAARYIFTGNQPEVVSTPSTGERPEVLSSALHLLAADAYLTGRNAPNPPRYREVQDAYRAARSLVQRLPGNRDKPAPVLPYTYASLSPTYPSNPALGSISYPDYLNPRLNVTGYHFSSPYPATGGKPAFLRRATGY
jgi:hypothetical protein